MTHRTRGNDGLRHDASHFNWNTIANGVSDNPAFVNTALVNTVLVAGGAVQAGPLTAAFTSENGAPNATVRPLDVARQGHTATSLQDGTVLIVGGAREPSAEVYAPAF